MASWTLKQVQGDAQALTEASFVQRESQPERDLIVCDLARLDIAAGADDFEPVDAADRRGGAGDRGLDRFLDAGRRAADDLDDLVDMLAHGALLSSFV